MMTASRKYTDIVSQARQQKAISSVWRVWPHVHMCGMNGTYSNGNEVLCDSKLI